jgi:flavin-dependent dehydrogenase
VRAAGSPIVDWHDEMEEADVIIVGGGPAGSTCAWKLRESGIDALILDKQQFPRTKLCAGWLTPKVVHDLKIDRHSYPYSMTKFNKLHIHLYGRRIPIKTTQYAIRRKEFDDWLIRRSHIPLIHHSVKHILKENGHYIIDQAFRCRTLVGAGGTNCPVYHTFFKNDAPRPAKKAIISLETEFPYDIADHNCYLWFYENKLPGYSWYVPKDEVLNIGIGGKLSVLKSRNETIRQHWDYFLEKLQKLSLISHVDPQPRGYLYYLRNKQIKAQKGNVYLIGDAAGLATSDMGEGIGPAVESGLRAAAAISSGKKMSFKSIRKYSFFQIVFSKRTS